MLGRLWKCYGVVVVAFVLCAADGLAAEADGATAGGPKVDSISIRKGSGLHHKANFDGRHLTTQDMPIAWLIELAYGLPGSVQVDGPDWVRFNGYDIQATLQDGSPGVARPTATRAAAQPALLALLRDRFQMQAHVEQRQQAAFALVVANAGPKLKAVQAKAGDVTPGGRMGTLVGHAGTMSMLASQLKWAAGGQVFDETALQGGYNFTLAWDATPDATVTPSNPANPELGKNFGAQCQRGQAGCVLASNVPELRVALEQELGLTLKPVRYAINVIVIEHIEKPDLH